ncbi:MAG: hypothetical protein RDU20_20585 [Desulfomonilaceae bacterium]|nr:hypothetical protein [Desulfomonilaceae bacterium]
MKALFPNCLLVRSCRRNASQHQVVYTDAAGNDHTLTADSVVLAMGARPENSLAKALENSGVDVRVTGAAAKCGRIGHAVEAGFTLACEL